MGRYSGKRNRDDFPDLPMTSLNLSKQLAHKSQKSSSNTRRNPAKEAKRLAVELMEKTGIPNAAKDMMNIAFQYSGGMRQLSYVIAIPLACANLNLDL